MLTVDQWNKAVDFWNSGASISDIARTLSVDLKDLKPFTDAIFDRVDSDETFKVPFVLPNSFKKSSVSEI